MFGVVDCLVFDFCLMCGLRSGWVGLCLLDLLCFGSFGFVLVVWSFNCVVWVLNIIYFVW